MGTTPKDANVEGSGTHFSRYAGDNESEASVEYDKRKADKRAKTYTYKNKNENINGLDNGVKQVFNNKGELLAEIRYAPRGENFEIRMDNYGIEKGSARKALAELMRDYPDKTFHWEAINEQSLKSYNHFVEEYPELAKRVQFTDDTPVTAAIDIDKQISYNSEKRVINETSDNRSANRRRAITEVRGIDSTANKGNLSEAERALYNEWGIPINNARRDIPESIHQPVRTGEIAYNKVETISERAKTITSNQQADDLLNEFVATTADKESISWKVSANNADEIYTKLMARGVRNLAGLREAFNKGDVDFVNWVVNKQLAAERLLGDLKAEIFLKLA